MDWYTIEARSLFSVALLLCMAALDVWILIFWASSKPRQEGRSLHAIFTHGPPFHFFLADHVVSVNFAAVSPFSSPHIRLQISKRQHIAI